MPLPTLEQYLNLIRTRDTASLPLIKDYIFLPDENGGFISKNGTSAVVFKALRAGKFHAIRFFLREEWDLFNRYEQTSAYLETKSLPWKVKFKYMERGLDFQTQFFPVVIMDWADGMQLNQFIDEEIFNQPQLLAIQKELVSLSNSLEEAAIGHGDIKFDNLLINRGKESFDLKVVDYDSMFIPAFEGMKNLEPGSPGFQHPRRLATEFNPGMDRFSIWVLITGLEALKVDPSLWTDANQYGYNRNRNLLFTLRDLVNPSSSKIIAQLQSYNNESLDYYLDKLIKFCKATRLDSIERPKLYKDAGYMPSKPVPVTVPVPQAPKAEEHFDVEIKSIPSGKDVLMRGVKKGITPLRLRLVRKDFSVVELVDDDKRITVPINEQIKTYEISIPKKEVPKPEVPKQETPKPQTSKPEIPKQETPKPPVTEPDEIIEFGADTYTVREGDRATLNWKVKGTGKIHISNIGEVAEKAGRKHIVLKDTTQYVLSVGTKKRSLTIRVEPATIPVKTFVEEEVVTEPLPLPKAPIKLNKKMMVWSGAVAAAIAVTVIGVKQFSGSTPDAAEHTTTQSNTALATATTFTKADVTDFLGGLYASYNKRNLKGIMTHYAGSVTEYYDSKTITKDSLSSIIKDLFIQPAMYGCKPNYKTLKIEPGNEGCKVTITITERLKSERRSATERYTTTIEYVLDPSYKIISEKSIETKS